MAFTQHPPIEARGWLRSNIAASAFACNRFHTTANALRFVDALYAEGASEVLIDDPGVDSDGQPYADTMLVRFSDPATGYDLERFCEREGPDPEIPDDFTLDHYEKELRLWWD